jgi:hypothetical protein
MSEREGLTADEFLRWWKETGERELRQLLYWQWDPIGVNAAFPSAADEYDSYAPGVVEALSRGEDEAQIAAMLESIERERMGLDGGGAERLRSAANRITSWYEQSQERWLNFGPLQR